ncbi:dolichyl-P-Man:Man(7)GlcNAc(2)-PP-dolichol alpha-1,6-mannosyltransferase [Scheffersomyces spartinae]|uniref:Mannosyltransferase n=1 Tax=Scheffersomyces spartinae TaxID=45513 RepID=A0A9P7V5E3_9ASCO|nr:dolichyl-P-Man:Man(7)GlcNAc(2)-PP-dolichol alpha-1,6-mannosyltransferase [Scheffersomyces spartinae]KAG7191459.1 dolichyl-P-Man:Man(7)GlcNAc(2)-PP-dolichol alpha-1,6-mannosyltransferase [Scheffersomyces spartinae]
MYRWSKALEALLILVVGYHLAIAPYTKVEESFTIQAAHDVMTYGVYPQTVIEDNYDHVNFPGVVPRTFVGSLVLGYIAKAIMGLFTVLGIDLSRMSDSQIIGQYIVRGTLGIINVLSLISIKDAINSVTFKDRSKSGGGAKRKGVVGFFYLLILSSLFHLLFYSSRTLPNFVALPLVNHSISKLIVGDITGFTWLGLTAVIFRLEVGVFGFIIAITSSLGFGQSNVFINLMLLAIGSLAGLFASGFVDSYFWGYWVIPEFSAMYFNVLQGKSSEWGVEPFWSYFTVHLPKLFKLILIPLLLKGFASDPADDGSTGSNAANDPAVVVVPHPARHGLRILFTSSLLYVIAMSFQPHKEWRFIIYVIPIFALQAANGAYEISHMFSKGIVFKLWILITILSLLGGVVVSLFMGYVSSFNYPGGEAIEYVNHYVLNDKKDVTVHLDVATCMTGFTRFTELKQDDGDVIVTYDKTEDPHQLMEKWNDFDLLVLSVTPDSDNWQLVHSITKYTRFNTLPVIFMIQELIHDKHYLPLLIMTMIDEAIEGRFDEFKRLLNSFIMTNNYLGVYKRIGNKITDIGSEVESQVVDEKNQQESNIDVEDVLSDINQEIDAIEAMT